MARLTWYRKSHGTPARLGLWANPRCWFRHRWYWAGSKDWRFCARCGCLKQTPTQPRVTKEHDDAPQA